MKETLVAHVTGWNWRARVPEVLGRNLMGVPVSGTLKPLPARLTLLRVRDSFNLSVMVHSLIGPESCPLLTWTYLLDRPVSRKRLKCPSEVP